MTIDRDVFLSILALDAYNRGYGANVGGILETESIGEASVISRGSIFDEYADQIYQAWQAAGFYAIAYDMTGVDGFAAGETVISFRGTNFPDEFTLEQFTQFYQQDFGGGWDLFTGIGDGSHAIHPRADPVLPGTGRGTTRRVVEGHPRLLQDGKGTEPPLFARAARLVSAQR